MNMIDQRQRNGVVFFRLGYQMSIIITPGRGGVVALKWMIMSYVASFVVLVLIPRESVSA